MISKPNLEENVLDGMQFTLYWKRFLSLFFNGDEGTPWTPAYSGLTGAATHTGRYYRLSNRLYVFRALITPDANTSSVAGTTVISNFPLTIRNAGSFTAVNNTTNVAIGTGVINTTGLYPPTWTTVTAPITLCGMVEVS